MLLLTGATGSIGSRLLPLLLERGEEVRCLVRDPRRLGARRVDVQIALGKPEAARKAVDNYQSMRNSATVLVLGVRAAVAQGDCGAAQNYAGRLRKDFGSSREALVMLPQVLGSCGKSASL